MKTPHSSGIRHAHTLWWIAVGLLLIVGGAFALRAGIDLREQVWRTTRSIRFQWDISNAYAIGNDALRHGEQLANLDPGSDAHGHPLSLKQMIDGMVGYYDDRVNDSTDEDYGVDYPPGRLAVMTFWVHHVQQAHPDLSRYPGDDHPPDVQSPQLEDFDKPLLDINNVCAALSAIGMLMLVWFWMARAYPTPAQWATPHGLLVFLVATSGFWYALLALAPLPLRPTPLVRLQQVQRDGPMATLTATVNAEGEPATACVQWGQREVYDHSTPPDSVRSRHTDSPVVVTFGPVGSEPIHFRMLAANSDGATVTQDVRFDPNGGSLDIDMPDAGGVQWPDWTVWARLLVLFIAMVASARHLPMPHRAWACAAVAALLVWFNPIEILNSHAWPQWDIWIGPFFIFAALLASLDWWLSAGVLIGLGCMFKGQLLLAAPILLLWPIFAGKPLAALRFFIGVFLAAGVVVSPWLLESPFAVRWTVMVLVAAAVTAGASLSRRTLSRLIRRVQPAPEAPVAIAAVICAAVAVLITFGGIFLGPAAFNPVSRWVLLGLALLVLLPPWFLARRWLGHWLAAVAASAIWLASRLFNGSDSWRKILFYGTQKHDVMAMGKNAFSGLAPLLSARYGWNLHDAVGNLHIGSLQIPPLGDQDLKSALALLYFVTLLICSASAATHDRRKDVRMLAALVAPWLLFPLLMTQMGERYLVMPAILTASFVALSTGLSLIHALLAVMSAGMLARQLLEQDPGRWPELYYTFSRMYPDVGWMMLLIAAVVLVAAVVPSPRRAPV